jgi:hypothetical protein
MKIIRQFTLDLESEKKIARMIRDIEELLEQEMTATDWAFKQWLEHRNADSAMKEVQESKKQNK